MLTYPLILPEFSLSLVKTKITISPLFLKHGFKVVVVPKIGLWKKKFFYDFKTGNYIISREICKDRHSF